MQNMKDERLSYLDHATKMTPRGSKAGQASFVAYGRESIESTKVNFYMVHWMAER